MPDTKLVTAIRLDRLAAFGSSNEAGVSLVFSITLHRERWRTSCAHHFMSNQSPQQFGVL